MKYNVFSCCDYRGQISSSCLSQASNYAATSNEESLAATTSQGDSNFRYTRISNNLRNNPPIYKFSNILVPYADMVSRDRIHELAE